MTTFLPFALPDIGEEEIEEVASALRSGWLTTGPKTKQFEADFKAFVDPGCEAIAVNSATAGLHLALEALGVGPGDEILVPTYTFTASGEVVRYLGADVKFVDVDRRTSNVTAADFEKAIGPRTKVLMPVHFAGLACDMDPILALARKHGLKVVEDAAHTLPTTYKGKPIGSLESDFTVFSFYATKTVPTGEGGMIVTKNAELAKRCRVMRLHGINRDAFDRYTSKVPSWYYEVVAPGFKYNMTDVASSIGIHQLRKAHALRDKREAMADAYDSALAGLPLELPARAPAGDLHAHHLYVVRLTDPRHDRGKVIEAMAEEGIGCSVHFIPCHTQPYWRERYSHQPGDFPNALANFERAVSLPLYTKMTPADQDRVVAALKKVLAR
jgi:dTDP-4-amino-4,6-dideoxygalactose transaminase